MPKCKNSDLGGKSDEEYIQDFMCSGFLVGLLVFCLAQNNNQAEVSSNPDDEIEPARPYVVKVIQSSISQNGSKKIIGQSTIYSKANGEYRHIAYGPNGPKGDDLLSKHSNELNIYVGLPDGIYRKEAGSNALTYSSPPADRRMLEFFRSHKYLRSHRDFVRTDKVAGLKV